MKTTKTFFLATTVVLLSAFATSCIPTGNPTPTNTFNVNLTTQATSNDTIIIVDGDSLAFTFFSSSFFGITTYLILSTNNPNFEILNTKEYPYNLNTDQYESSETPTNDVNTINAGIHINDAYTANPWIPLIFADLSGLGVVAKPYFSLSTLDISFSDAPSWLRYGMKKNVDQYVVLRKLKGTQHQYYWIKVRHDAVGTALGVFKILNGKFQLNSITTGQ